MRLSTLRLRTDCEPLLLKDIPQTQLERQQHQVPVSPTDARLQEIWALDLPVIRDPISWPNTHKPSLSRRSGDGHLLPPTVHWRNFTSTPVAGVLLVVTQELCITNVHFLVKIVASPVPCFVIPLIVLQSMISIISTTATRLMFSVTSHPMLHSISTSHQPLRHYVDEAIHRYMNSVMCESLHHRLSPCLPVLLISIVLHDSPEIQNCSPFSFVSVCTGAAVSNIYHHMYASFCSIFLVSLLPFLWKHDSFIRSSDFVLVVIPEAVNSRSPRGSSCGQLSLLEGLLPPKE